MMDQYIQEMNTQTNEPLKKCFKLNKLLTQNMTATQLTNKEFIILNEKLNEFESLDPKYFKEVYIRCPEAHLQDA